MRPEIERVLFVVLVMAACAALPTAVAQDGPPDAPVETPVEGTEEPVEVDPLEEDILNAKALVVEAKYAEAVAVLEPILEERGEDVDLLALYGEVLLADGSPDKAAPVLEKAIGIAPERPRLHFQLAAARLAIGNVDGAIEAFGAEIGVNEDNEIRFMAHMNRSILLDQKKRFAEAAADLEAAIAIKDDNAMAYGDLARLYLQADEMDDALEAMRRGEERGFRSGSLYFNAGARFYNAKDYEAAEAAFRKAIEIKPEMAEAHRSLASTLVQTDRSAEAAEHYRRYLELRPDAPDADEIRGHIESASNN
ncbi:MAG: tetratricopeptide repeat protein [Acidobacteriota bacterium]|nr:tetratricopeptide repeat protein [Acidobacteriota bacterium]